MNYQSEIEKLEFQVEPLLAKINKLKREKSSVLSRKFIGVNQITRKDVEMSSGNGTLWFGTVLEFGKWLAQNSTKVWAEWNGRIYYTADLVNGRMPDMPGNVDDLPNPSSTRAETDL